MLSVLTKRKLQTQTAPASAVLWRLAMRRLRADKIAIASLIVVLFYLVVLLLSFTGVIASDWNKEVAVSYAPPTFIGADKTTDAGQKAAAIEEELPENPVDPLKDVIDKLKAENAELRGKIEPGTFTGTFAMRADRQTRRIGSVLVGLTPIPPAGKPSPKA